MIVSAKVIGAWVSYETYSRQSPDIKRGHKDFIMSRSEIVNFASNPKRWLDGYKEDDEGTTKTVFGSLVECVAGLSGNFDDLYVVAPAEYKDEKSGKMKKWTFKANVCKEWREEQGNREVITEDVYLEAKKAVDCLLDDPNVAALFKWSEKQVMVAGIWKSDDGVEIPLRCLLDLVPDGKHSVYGKVLADLKTARNGDPEMWWSVVDKSGYDVQAALSRDLYETATGEDRTDWVFAVIENVPPYHVVKPMPALSSEFLKWGRLKYQAALRRYAECLATGVWPSYSTGNRLVMGPFQLIGPESLWKYREMGGIMPFSS